MQPLLRFVSSHEPADRIVEVPVNMPSTEPFDLLRIVEALSCWGSWEVSRENKQVPARPGPGLCLVIMHDDPQVLLNQLFTGIIFLCGSVRLEPAFLAPDGPVALGGEGQVGERTQV